LLNGIESLQFDTRISDAELPIHRADSLIAMLLPTLNLVTEVLDGGNVVSQTLPRQHAEFDLSNVEPAGVDAACNGSPTARQGHAPVQGETLRRRRRVCGY
jgi:hypothetical protein